MHDFRHNSCICIAFHLPDDADASLPPAGMPHSLEAYEHERVRMEESIKGLRTDLEAALRHGSEARAHAGRLAKELADAEGKMLRAMEERDRLREVLGSESAGRAADVAALKKSLEAEKTRADGLARCVSNLVGVSASACTCMLVAVCYTVRVCVSCVHVLRRDKRAIACVLTSNVNRAVGGGSCAMGDRSRAATHALGHGHGHDTTKQHGTDMEDAADKPPNRHPRFTNKTPV